MYVCNARNYINYAQIIKKVGRSDSVRPDLSALLCFWRRRRIIGIHRYHCTVQGKKKKIRAQMQEAQFVSLEEEEEEEEREDEDDEREQAMEPKRRAMYL